MRNRRNTRRIPVRLVGDNPMRTPTNHEDNFMWREARRTKVQAQEREQEILHLIQYHLTKLRLALWLFDTERDDFELSDEDITRRIREAL